VPSKLWTGHSTCVSLGQYGMNQPSTEILNFF